jgi:hypothetical protein
LKLNEVSIGWIASRGESSLLATASLRRWTGFRGLVSFWLIEGTVRYLVYNIPDFAPLQIWTV